jgi:hypothetical protein
MRVLTEEAQKNRDAFDSYAKEAGCGCHSHPPCSYCTHPGNPMNQEEDETCWTIEYTKDEALWWAICQMRRTSRMLDLEEVQLEGKEYLVSIYGAGLDMCADQCEKAMDPEELKRMRGETFPNTCPTCARSGLAARDNETGGIDICYDPWHDVQGESNDR